MDVLSGRRFVRHPNMTKCEQNKWTFCTHLLSRAHSVFRTGLSQISGHSCFWQLCTVHYTQKCSLLPAGFQKQEIRTNVILFFLWTFSWLNEQGSFLGSINLGIVGQRVWVPFYQPLVTDSQRSLFNEKGTWRLWVQGSQRNVLKPHKGAEGRVDGDEMGDQENDDMFNFLSM